MARDRLIAGPALVALAGAGALTVGNLRGTTGARQVQQNVGLEPIRFQPPVAAAYRYPLGCLGEALSGNRSASDPRGPCWRYGVYLTVVLHRQGSGWRLALEAISPTCPALSLPPLVRAQVAICRRRVR